MKRAVVIVAGAVLGSLAGFRLLSPSDRGRDVSEPTADWPARTQLAPEREASHRAHDSNKHAIRPPALRSAAAPVVQSDPLSADYDPVKLSTIGHQPAAIFEAEPRLKKWAEPMEQTLSKRMAADIEYFSKSAKIVSTECRSSSCLIKVEAPHADADRVFLGLQVPPLGDVMQPAVSDESVDSGPRRFSLHVLFGKESRDLARYARIQKQRRAAVLTFWRKAGLDRLAELGIDPSRLPPVEVPP